MSYSIQHNNETIAAFDDVLDVIRFTNKYITTAKTGDYITLHVLERDAEGELKKIATAGGQAGYPNLSFQLVKRWTDQQKAANKPHSLDDFYRTMGLCRACRGWGRKSNSPKATLPCGDCDSTGKHKDTRIMQLIVVEIVTNAKPSVLALETGSAAECMKCYTNMRKSGHYDDFAQFRIEEDGHVIAIEVHGSMLWLKNVPPPQYFVPPKPKGLVVTGFADKSRALIERKIEEGFKPGVVEAALKAADRVMETPYEAVS